MHAPTTSAPSRPARIFLASLWGVATALPFFAGCHPPNLYQAPPPPQVTVAHPQQRTVMDVLEFTGTTQPTASVEIRARVEGFLMSIDFQEGTNIKAGDLLFRIDPLPLEATLAQAQASLQLATAQREIARAELKRTRAEVSNAETQLRRAEKASRTSPGAVSQEEIDLKATAVLTAKAAVESAQAAITSATAQMAAATALITQAELNLSYTEVRSPIDGRAGRKRVDVGNLVGPNQSAVLTNVVRYDPIFVYFNVNENDLLRFLNEQPRAPDQAEIPLQLPLQIGLGIDQGFPHEGMAEYSDLAVDQNTGTYLIRGVVPNPDRRIPPGAFARVRVPRGEIEALLIDPRAVGHDQSGPYLLVVNDEETIERRSIELAGKYEGLQAIQGAITTEDRVVVQGLQRARPGAKVVAEISTKASEESALAPVPQTDQQLPPAAIPTEE